jgi:hypothetical protein
VSNSRNLQRILGVGLITLLIIILMGTNPIVRQAEADDATGVPLPPFACHPDTADTHFPGSYNEVASSGANPPSEFNPLPDLGLVTFILEIAF